MKAKIVIAVSALLIGVIAPANADLYIQSPTGLTQEQWNASDAYKNFNCPNNYGREEGVDLNFTTTRADDYWYVSCAPRVEVTPMRIDVAPIQVTTPPPVVTETVTATVTTNNITPAVTIETATTVSETTTATITSVTVQSLYAQIMALLTQLMALIAKLNG